MSPCRKVHAPRDARGDIACPPEQGESHAPWFLLFMLLFAMPMYAQSAVTGFVRDSTGRPLPGAEVSIEALGKRALSDANGRYILAEVPAGMRLVRARRVGYVPMTSMLRFAAEGTQQANFVLERSPQQLDTLTVQEKARIMGVGVAGFDERRRKGFGVFFDSSFIAKNEHRRLPDLVQGASSVRVLRQPGWFSSICPMALGNTRLGQRGDCLLEVWLDGQVVQKGGYDWATVFDLNRIPLSEIKVVEIYRGASEVPMEYSGATSECGAMLLWTRGR